MQFTWQQHRSAVSLLPSCMFFNFADYLTGLRFSGGLTFSYELTLHQFQAQTKLGQCCHLVKQFGSLQICKFLQKRRRQAGRQAIKRNN